MMDHLVQVVNQSASCNYAQVYRYSDGSSNWKWRNWDVFLAEHFKPLKGIRKLHHFHFSSTEPGTVYVKESIHDTEVPVNILKGTANVSQFSPSFHPNSYRLDSLSIVRVTCSVLFAYMSHVTFRMNSALTHMPNFCETLTKHIFVCPSEFF